MIRIAEEIDIVRAYLEIEQLRLGPKLRSEIEVDDERCRRKCRCSRFSRWWKMRSSMGSRRGGWLDLCECGSRKRGKRYSRNLQLGDVPRTRAAKRCATASGWRMCGGGWRFATAEESTFDISSANDVTHGPILDPVQHDCEWPSVHRGLRVPLMQIMPTRSPAKPGNETWLACHGLLTMALKTLIVDDEPVARRVLREELEQIDDVALIGEAEDGDSALAAIRDSSPDLVFLDLQMPGLGGFDVIRKLQPGERIPMIVIVTAWDQYAIQAFEAGAIDYLLKPIGQERLAQAVERAMKLRARPAEVAQQLANGQGDCGGVIGQSGQPRQVTSAGLWQRAATNICC